MKIVIASDSFKGTLSSKEACMAVKVGLRKSHPDVEIDIFPVSDGGDGSLEVLSHYLRCEPHLIQVLDPCGEEIQSLWLKSGNKAFIEVASASGINLLKGRLHPLKANTYGTGQQILQAIEAGCDEIILFLGGSATTDCGSGILAALGFKFLNSEGELIRPSGGELNRISQIDTSGVSNKVFKVDFKIATDVTNPLSGKLGTAQIYAPQKGATPEDVITLERNLEEFSKLLYRQTGNDLSGTAGSGAAGGIPAGLLSFFKGEIVSGYEFFRDLSGLSAAIACSNFLR
jgi:glycerate kinase